MKVVKRRAFAMLTMGLVAACAAFAAAAAQPTRAQPPVSFCARIPATITKADAPDPVAAGGTITYTISLNPGQTADDGALNDEVPLQTTFNSFTAPAGWIVTTPPAGGTGTVTATHPDDFSGTQTFTLVVNVLPTATGIIANFVAVSFQTPIPNLCEATAETAVSADGVPPCPPNEDDDGDGLTNNNESRFSTLLGNGDSDLDGIADGDDDANGNGEDDEDEDDDENDGCPDEDSDDDGEDDEDEDDDEEDDD